MNALTKRRVKFLAEHEGVDARAFDVLFRSLQRRRATLITGPENLMQAFPAFHQLFWRADQRRLAEGVDRQGRIEGAVVVHQGGHSLIAEDIGDAIHEDPCLSLLGEAFASAINVYFSFTMMRRWKIPPARAVKIYRGPRTRSPVALPAIRSDYLRFARAPMESLARLTREIWQTYRTLFELDERRDATTRQRVQAMRAFIEQMESPWIMTRMDISNNYLFARSHYPRPITTARLNAAERHLARWFGRPSESVAELLERIEAA